MSPKKSLAYLALIPMMTLSSCSLSWELVTPYTLGVDLKKNKRTFKESVKIFYDFASHINGTKTKNNFYTLKDSISFNYLFPNRLAPKDSSLTFEDYRGKSMHQLKEEYNKIKEIK